MTQPDAAPVPRAPLTPAFDAVVLAGGRARRLGGVSKPDVVVGGRPLLDHALDAAAGARQVVVVGPPELARPGVATVLEEPASGGPVAGIAAGLQLLDATSGTGLPVLLLACDVPSAARAVPALAAAAAGAPEADGALLVDLDGRPQIVALVRREALAAALRTLAGGAGVHGASFRRLVEELSLVPVDDPSGVGSDADTWDDVRRLDTLLRGGTVTESSAGAPAAGSSDGPAAAGSDLHRWVVEAAHALGVDPDVLDVDLLLDLARDVAHIVMRPAVPLTTFLVGYAVAAGGGDRAALDRVAARAADLARRWEAGESGGAAPGGTP